MTQLPPKRTPNLDQALRPSLIAWGFCCCSPILYLLVAWFLQKTWLKGQGLYPLPHDTWLRILVALGVLCLILQIAHVLVKLRWKDKLQQTADTPSGFEASITKRTMTLIFFSELPVMLGFCLFLIQGNLDALFGFGLFAMLLYAQSHPRSQNPAFL